MADEPPFIPRTIDFDITLDVLGWLLDRSTDTSNRHHIIHVLALVEDAEDGFIR